MDSSKPNRSDPNKMRDAIPQPQPQPRQQDVFAMSMAQSLFQALGELDRARDVIARLEQEKTEWQREINEVHSDEDVIRAAERFHA